MRYITEDFFPISKIPHTKIKRQLNEPISYSFPILRKYSLDLADRVPSELTRWFVEESKRATDFLNIAKLQEDDRQLRNHKLTHKIVHTDQTMVVSSMDQKQRPDLANPEQALILALLHDIGRFEEFIQGDSNSKNHAQLSAEIIESKLRKDNKIKKILGEHFDLDSLIEAIAEHSKAEYHGQNKFAKFIRDVDKIAITAEVNAINKYFLPCPDDKDQTLISPKVRETYLQSRTVFNEDYRTVADSTLRTVSFIPLLYYKESLELAKKLKLTEFLYRKLLEETTNLDDELRKTVEEDLGIE